MLFPLFHVPHSKWIMNLQQKKVFYPSFIYLNQSLRLMNLQFHSACASQRNPDWCWKGDRGAKPGVRGWRDHHCSIGRVCANSGLRRFRVSPNTCELARNIQSCCYTPRGNALSFKDSKFIFYDGLDLAFFFPQTCGGTKLLEVTSDL